MIQAYTQIHIHTYTHIHVYIHTHKKIYNTAIHTDKYTFLHTRTEQTVAQVAGAHDIICVCTHVHTLTHTHTYLHLPNKQ